MDPIPYHSTRDINVPGNRVSFREAVLNPNPELDGLYTVRRRDLPQIDSNDLAGLSYADIAHRVLRPFVTPDIPEVDLERMMHRAYPNEIAPQLRRVERDLYLLELTHGPTYAFKDYAARFFAQVINYFLEREEKRKTVLVATSGDTGGAVADALHGMPNVDVAVFYPRGKVTDVQRRQMTTLGGNVHPIEVNGNFDVCQEIVKTMLGDTEYQSKIFNDPEGFTTANSINIARLLAQVVFPFYVASRLPDEERLTVSIPSGNFGNMMGTMFAKHMGAPLGRIIVAVNENSPFPHFMETGRYEVGAPQETPSSAMDVVHPNNLERFLNMYGVRVDQEDRPIMTHSSHSDLISSGVTVSQVDTPSHASIMQQVYTTHHLVIDPHTAVAWNAVETQRLPGTTVMYSTAHSAKFPEVVGQAIGERPEVPERIARQASVEERFEMVTAPSETKGEKLVASDAQIAQTRCILANIFATRDERKE